MHGMVAFVEITEVSAHSPPRARGQDRSHTFCDSQPTKPNESLVPSTANYPGNARLGTCSRDPIGYEGSPWNLYEYVLSAPITGTDSEGLALDSITSAIEQCSSKATPQAQIECYELFISQGIDKTGVLRQAVNKIRYGKPRAPRPNPRRNRRGTKCTEAQHNFFHGGVFLACKIKPSSCGKAGERTNLTEEELLTRSAIASACAQARFAYQRLCFTKANPEWQEHENKRGEAKRTASICLQKAKKCLR